MNLKMPGLPRVTVLMPVYEGEKFLQQAIESILAQTFQDLEFLIINDGSTDRSAEIVEAFRDPRIRHVHNDKNVGLIATLNRGLSLARGEYIARMDCDDISLPMRLEKQVKFMDSHRDVAVCGSWVKAFGKEREEIWRYPTDHEHIRSSLLFNSALSHSSVIMSKDMINKSGLFYSPACRQAEDYDFWVRVSSHAAIANIGEVLVHYRLHPEQIGQWHGEEQKKTSGLIRLNQLQELGINPSPEEFDIHQAISQGELKPDKDFVNRADVWLQKLRRINKVSAVYYEPAFSEVLALRWIHVCSAAKSLGSWTLSKFLQSPLRRYYPKTVWSYLLFSARGVTDCE